MSAEPAGAKLRRERFTAELSERDLGRRVGVTGAAVHAWEHSRSSPNAAHRARLAAVLGVDVYAEQSVAS